jgi:hypothetical protein
MNTESLQYRIPAFGSHVAAFMFNQRRWDLAVVPLGGGPLSEAEQADYKVRGLELVGCCGFISGKLCLAWEHRAPDDSVIDFLSRRYAEWLYATLATSAPRKLAMNDAVDWLRALYNLPSEDRAVRIEQVCRACCIAPQGQ